MCLLLLHGSLTYPFISFIKGKVLLAREVDEIAPGFFCSFLNLSVAHILDWLFEHLNIALYEGQLIFHRKNFIQTEVDGRPDKIVPCCC